MPQLQTIPIVLASPHSGTNYPAEFIAQSRLSAKELRRSEDTFVETLFADGPSLGAPLLSAQYPRAFLDLNREPFELDADMFDEPLPAYVNTTSPRVSAGLGTVAKLVGNGAYIYRNKLRFADVQARIEQIYRPYHRKLAELVTSTRDRFGYCILIDCHSMPSSGSGLPATRPHVVLGDCHGLSARSEVMDTIASALKKQRYRVARNNPYAGGFTTHHYGRPPSGLHVVQMEIARNLYMDEASHTKLPAFDQLRANLKTVIADLATLDGAALLPHQQAAQ